MKGAASAILIAFTAFGATPFWEARSLETWSAKDVEQIRTRSPWAHTVNAAIPAEEMLILGGEGRRGRGGGLPDSSAAVDINRGVRPQERAEQPPFGEQAEDAVNRVVPMIIRWDSALPQAG